VGTRAEAEVDVSKATRPAGKEVDVSQVRNWRANARDVGLLATIAHDLRHSLAIVRGNARLLRLQATQDHAPPGPWLDGGLADIEDAGTQMAQLIDEMVDVARSRSGDPLPLERRPTNLAELAARVAANLGSAGERGRVRLERIEPAPIGHWDAARLRRVAENLLGNALKYSPPAREVIVRVGTQVRRDGVWAVLEVRDHGRGIPAADLPHLFEPFRRGSNVAGVSGSGLGLASVKRIVEAHGGGIAVESAEGEGTTVTVHLPGVDGEPGRN
jgi:signal transduction histidine kinase